MIDACGDRTEIGRVTAVRWLHESTMNRRASSVGNAHHSGDPRTQSRTGIRATQLDENYGHNGGGARCESAQLWSLLFYHQHTRHGNTCTVIWWVSARHARPEPLLSGLRIGPFGVLEQADVHRNQDLRTPLTVQYRYIYKVTVTTFGFDNRYAFRVLCA